MRQQQPEYIRSMATREVEPLITEAEQTHYGTQGQSTNRDINQSSSDGTPAVESSNDPNGAANSGNDSTGVTTESNNPSVIITGGQNCKGNKTCIQGFWFICVVVLWIAIIIALLASFVRLGFLCFLVATHYKNTTKVDHTHLYHSRLVYLTMTLVEVLYVMEVFVLICSIISFCQYTKKKHEGINMLQLTVRAKDLTAICCRLPTCCGDVNVKAICVLVSTVIVIVILLLVLLYSTITFVPPSLLMMWMKEIVLAFVIKKDYLIGRFYAGMAWIKHFTGWMIRIGMIIATLRIRGEWYSEIKVAKNIEEGDVQTEFTALVKTYDKRGQLVASLQSVFEVWFVLQWIGHFIRIGMDCVLVIRSLITNDFETEGGQTWFTLTHLLHDITAFMIPYFCGTAMNMYNRKFLSNMAEKQSEIISKSQDISVWFIQRSILIPEIKSYQFLPSLFGIGIPLESTGYTISIVVSLFTFATSLMLSFARSVS